MTAREGTRIRTQGRTTRRFRVDALEPRLLLATASGVHPIPDPLDEAILFRLPLATDTTTHFYFDRDPAAGVDRAWNGSTSTVYDGHTGSDFSGGPRGKPIYAAADGILTAVVDGFGDQQGTANGNYVKLNHGNDRNGNPIVTFYLHMNAGTPTTKPLGSFIAAGEQIGGVGTSGNSTGLHLHFHATYDGGAFDPFAAAGETTWWVNQGSGSPATTTPAKKFTVGQWVEVFALTAGDTATVRSPNPNSASIGGKPNGAVGQILEGAQLSYTGGDYNGNVYTRYKVRFTDGVEGWVAQNWLKAAPPAPADITVFRGTTTYVSGQTTLEFGSVERKQNGPVRTVNVRNDGSQTLTLGAVAVPSGFTVVEGLPTTLAVGASDSMTIRLDSATAGTKSGVISIASSDPDENPFTFTIQGSVTPDVTAPTVDVIDVSPDPRTMPPSGINIVFSEAVVGFGIEDLTLKRNGGAIALTAAQTLTTGSNVGFTLNNLAPLMDASGTYVLTVNAGGVTDDSSNTLATPASDSFVLQTNVFRGDASGAATADSFYLRRSEDGTQLEVFENTPPNGTPTYVLAWAGVSSLVLEAGGGDNVVTLDYTRGDPVPAGFAYTASGGGTRSLALTGPGTFTFAGSEQFKSLDLGGGANAAVAGDGGRVIVLDALAVAGGSSLDLVDNDMVLRGAPVATVDALLAAGKVVASASFDGYTGLGGAPASALFGLNGGDTATFAGQTVSAGDVLVKFTYVGDANLDGFISGDDYAAIDLNIASPGASGWWNGDFNGDGIISGDDYAAIDFNIVAQGAPL